MVFLDEIYSNIDEKNCQNIRDVIDQAFGSKTVIQISHKLDTIIESDQVIVMSCGSVVENEHPFKLLANSNTDVHISNSVS